MNQIKHFLDYLAIEKRYSPRTVSEYGDDLRFLCKSLGVAEDAFDANSVGTEDIRTWMMEMMDHELSARTVKRRLSAVRSLYKFLLRTGVVKKDVTNTIILPKADKPLPIRFRESEMEAVKVLSERTWDEDEEDDEKRFCRLRDYVVIQMLYQTGMRRAELAGLTDADVDMNQAQVRVFGKRRKERVVPMGEGLVQLIQTYKELRDAVCCKPFAIMPLLVKKHRDGTWGALSGGDIYNIVRARMGEVSTLKKHSPHVLRHTFASTMLDHGADIRTIQSLLGHASVATTQIYTHTSFEEIRKIYSAAHPRNNNK